MWCVLAALTRLCIQQPPSCCIPAEFPTPSVRLDLRSPAAPTIPTRPVPWLVNPILSPLSWPNRNSAGRRTASGVGNQANWTSCFRKGIPRMGEGPLHVAGTL